MGKLREIITTTKYNLSKKGRAEYSRYFEETHDKAHGIGKYRKKRR